ncbi:endolytic transglycosylase MltG [Ktedonobacter robiniae]|uniref:Endolytic murein transglycosylase n=1 Tax=Ktedonobacter robiniae TaxID=2778365 RepID=A0ABQ3UWD3_9CHLR|nr:endolytic transglycosylase MltG [Ktedonobacter robiniae]GHO56993.1 aminodeoxychorismate lyase [Ktedonobacter robiniae]
MKKRGYGPLIAVFLVTLIMFGALWESWSALNTLLTPPDVTKTDKISLVINDGESTQQIADELQARGLVRNALAFRLLARIKGLDVKLQAGAYTLTPGMNTDQIITKLLNGQPDGKRFLIQDGYRLEQIANSAAAIGLPHFSKDDFLNYTKHPDKFPDKAKYPILNNLSSMEGLLFPETYTVPVTYNTVQMIDMILDQFIKVEKDNNLVAQAQQHQLSEYEMIILASIVQREASNAKQMPTIAGIYWNLDKNTSNDETVGLLSSDPTVEYAYDTDHPPANGKYWRDLNDYGSGKTVEQDNPFNTYWHKGWTPTPISSPNLAALQAAASPAKTDCYFFLTNPANGDLVCATTYADHQKNVAKYLQH